MSSLPERPECRRRAGGDRIAVGEEDDAGLQLKCQNRSAVICVQRSSSNTGNGFSLDKSAATAHKLGSWLFCFWSRSGLPRLHLLNSTTIMTCRWLPLSLFAPYPHTVQSRGTRLTRFVNHGLPAKPAPILSPPCVKSSV